MGGGAAKGLTLRLSDMDVTHAPPAATQYAARSGNRLGL